MGECVSWVGGSGRRGLGGRGQVLRRLGGLGRWFAGLGSWWEIGTVCGGCEGRRIYGTFV